MIKLRMLGDSFYPKLTKFPAGEVNISLPERMSEILISRDVAANITIEAEIKSSDDIMELLLVNDAIIQSFGQCPRRLVLAYVPYARQDRVCNPGESLSIKVFANLINSMGFERVTTIDNHSDVATALIDNCINIRPEKIMRNSSEITALLMKTRISLCAPDAGAAKKVHEVSRMFKGLNVIQASKIRDTKTGEITGTRVDEAASLNGQSVMVVDDICDGGMTFIKLAEKLKFHGAGELFLYVTHGIFSKGIECLNAYTRIYTTDSYASKEFYEGTNVHVIKI